VSKQLCVERSGVFSFPDILSQFYSLFIFIAYGLIDFNNGTSEKSPGHTDTQLHFPEADGRL